MVNNTGTSAPGDIGDLTGKTVRGYELRELIGSGGFAMVYKAYQQFQTNIGRDVAVKIILPVHANNPDFIRRFEYEAQIIARLEYPFIVPLFDYWREPDAAYLVMRWLQGGSLATELRKGRLEPLRVARYLDQIAPALDYAHKRGIIHRDLKPDNLLLDMDDNVYLADFGIAKDTVNSDTSAEADTIVGSPSYFPPEQIQGQEVGPSADIYSLGIALYELLTGQVPFPISSVSELIYKHIHEPLPPLRTHVAGLPEGLDEVIQTAAAKLPEARYPSARELAAAFRQAITPAAPAAPLIIEGEPEALDELIVIDLDEHPSSRGIIQLPISMSLTPDNPYKGLRAFSENDAEDFFGRETLIEELIHQMVGKAWGSRFLAVVGPSGSGKSSVVSAGVIPKLRGGAIPGSDKWFITDMVPGNDPYEELERALLKIAVTPPADMQAQLRADTNSLVTLVGKILPDAKAELLLMIDQFEEVFTQLADEQTRINFLKMIFNAVTSPNSHLRVIITLRADFFDKPLQYQEFGELIRQRNEVVLPLNTDELTLAIRGPAQRAGLIIGSELVDAMVRDVGAQAGALPLLQFALTELYERRQGNMLSLNAYLQSGGVVGALARRAEDIYSGLSEDSKQAVRQLFLRLVTLGEGTEDTRRRVKMKELLSLTRNSEAIEDVINTFSRFRLLTLDRDDESREPTVEVAHEALIRSWERLREWLRTGRDELIIHRRLTQAATDWVNAKRETSYLASGARLEQFEQWRQTATLTLSEQEEIYLNASLAERARLKEIDDKRRSEEQRVAKLAQNFQRASIVLGVVGVLALAAMIISLVQGGQARAQVADAQATLTPIASTLKQADTRLASVLTLIDAERSLSRPGADPEQGLLLGIRSLKLSYSQDADWLVVKAIDQGKAQRVLATGVDGVTFAGYSPDGKRVAVTTFFHQLRVLDANTGDLIKEFVGHTGVVYKAAWSPDGKRLATGESESLARIWNAETGELIHELTGHSQGILDVSFSPDGKQLLTTSEDGTARLWDTESGTELQTAAQWPSAITSGVFSTDGKRILLCGKGGRWEVWSITANPATKVFEGNGDDASVDFKSAHFSHDGKSFAFGGSDGTVRIHDATTGSESTRLATDSSQALNSIDLSPDGRQAVGGSLDGKIHLWNIVSPSEVQVLSGHSGYVDSVMFSPDGSKLLSSGNDRIVRTWTLVFPLDPRDLKGNAAEIYTLVVSPNGRYLASGGNDRTVRLYDLTTGEQVHNFVANNSQEPIAHTDSVNSVQFSPDGKYLLSGAADGFLRLWDVESGKLVRELEYPNHEIIYAGVFTLDGNYFVTTSQDGTLRRWSMDTFQEVKSYLAHTDATYGVNMMSDGKFMISSSADTTTRLWNIETGELVRTINNINPDTGKADPVFGFAATPDGKYVFASGPNPTINMFDVQTGKLVRQFIGHTKDVQTLNVSHDGKLLLSGSQDGSVRLWDVETGQEIRRYIGLSDAVSVAVFSTDEKYVIAGSWAREIRVWDTTVSDLLTYACSIAYRDFTAEERALFSITDTEATCPQFANAPTR